VDKYNKKDKRKKNSFLGINAKSIHVISLNYNRFFRYKNNSEVININQNNNLVSAIKTLNRVLSVHVNTNKMMTCVTLNKKKKKKKMKN